MPTPRTRIHAGYFVGPPIRPDNWSARSALISRAIPPPVAIATFGRCSAIWSLYYQHFSGKQDLFRTAVLDAVDQSYETFRPHNEALADVADHQFTDALLDLADLAYRGLLAPELLRMRRLVMAEAERFPRLGREYDDRSWRRSVGGLADSIARLHTRGC